MGGLVTRLGRRLRLSTLTDRHSMTAIMGLFAGVNGCIAIGIMSAAAWLTGQPLVFPSLGPTAFLLFSTPTLPAAWPRSTILGHLIGAVAGYAALVVFGLQHAAFGMGVTGPRVGAAAVSLGLTAALMVWLKVPHPPAGATTLIVSLGILHTIPHLAALMLAVVLLVAQGFVINRLAGVDYPVWHRDPASGQPEVGGSRDGTDG